MTLGGLGGYESAYGGSGWFGHGDGFVNQSAALPGLRLGALMCLCTLLPGLLPGPLLRRLLCLLLTLLLCLSGLASAIKFRLPN